MSDAPSTAGQDRAGTKSWRLVATLAAAGAIAGLLIVTVHQWAEPRILTNQARVIAAAVDEVLGGEPNASGAFDVDPHVAGHVVVPGRLDQPAVLLCLCVRRGEPRKVGYGDVYVRAEDLPALPIVAGTSPAFHRGLSPTPLHHVPR